jgi:ABC-type multidrug transport system permease subunit
MTHLLTQFADGTFHLLLKMFLIVVPIMVAMELFEGSRPYTALVHGWARLVGRLGLTENTAAPTLIGLLFGLAYAGGVIVRDTRRQRITRRQVLLMSVFLSMVHAIFEDSLVWIAVGASAVWVVGFRVLWAIAVTAVVGVVLEAFLAWRGAVRAGPHGG